MTIRCATSVEFYGGPLDGHVEIMDLPLESFLGIKSIPVTHSNTFVSALLRFLHFRSSSNPTVPLAFYKCDENDDMQPSYRYVGTRVVNRRQLQGGFRLNVVT